MWLFFLILLYPGISAPCLACFLTLLTFLFTCILYFFYLTYVSSDDPSCIHTAGLSKPTVINQHVNTWLSPWKSFQIATDYLPGQSYYFPGLLRQPKEYGSVTNSIEMVSGSLIRMLKEPSRGKVPPIFIQRSLSSIVCTFVLAMISVTHQIFAPSWGVTPQL
jgi:hypothetical protein